MDGVTDCGQDGSAMKINEESVLDIEGIGIILFSPASVRHIKQGEDYLTYFYSEEGRVQAHIQEGSIVGFCTGSSGRYLLRPRMGYPSDEELADSEFRLRLGLVCRDDCVHFRDLYDLLSWSPDTPEQQVLYLPRGIYHITLTSKCPDSGILGDNQRINCYFNPLASFPKLTANGVPHLCE